MFFNFLTLTPTQILRADLDSTANFHSENVYFDHSEVKNKKATPIFRFTRIPHSLLQRSMQKWVDDDIYMELVLSKTKLCNLKLFKPFSTGY